MVYDVISPREDKSGKTRWIRVGVGFQSKNGTRVLLDAYPAPNKEGDVILIIKERTQDGLPEKNDAKALASEFHKNRDARK